MKAKIPRGDPVCGGSEACHFWLLMYRNKDVLPQYRYAELKGQFADREELQA